MPLEPPTTAWSFPPPYDADGDLVAVGGDLEPGTLLAAYRQGLFPMPASPDAWSRWSRQPTPMAWWSPCERGVLPLDALRVTRSMRQSARHLEIRLDSAFEEVVAGCADPSRTGSWIDGQIAAAYAELHRLGWAHSVETWRDGELVGGLYGVAIGGLFAGESMFSRARDASKAALMALVDLLGDEHADRRLLDTQWRTDHLATLGVVEVDRRVYLALLEDALTVPLPAAWAASAT